MLDGMLDINQPNHFLFVEQIVNIDLVYNSREWGQYPIETYKIDYTIVLSISGEYSCLIG